MDRNEIIRQIEEIGIVPVVRAASSDEAMKAIDAIREGGIHVLEITMTVPGAIRVIEDVSQIALRKTIHPASSKGSTATFVTATVTWSKIYAEMRLDFPSGKIKHLFS